MFEKVIEFFKSRKTTTTIQPEIKVDYICFLVGEDMRMELRKQWEGLLQQLSLEPSIVQSRKWSSYITFDGERREEIKICIDGVILKLEGPYYPDPDWVKPPIREPKSESEQGNEAIDGLLRTTNMTWALTHCSDRKFEAFIEFLKATRASRTIRA